MPREVEFPGQKKARTVSRTITRKKRVPRSKRIADSVTRKVFERKFSGRARVPGVIRTGKPKKGRGRPPASYKYISPITGQPVPATVHKAQVQALKQRARAVSEARDLQQIQALARRGIPPEQARVIVNSQQLRQVLPQQSFEQSELQRAQTAAPFAKQEIIRNLMRRRAIAEQAQRARVPVVQQEVSLLDGKTYQKENSMMRKEKWTYS